MRLRDVLKKWHVGKLMDTLMDTLSPDLASEGSRVPKKPADQALKESSVICFELRTNIFNCFLPVPKEMVRTGCESSDVRIGEPFNPPRRVSGPLTRAVINF